MSFALLVLGSISCVLVSLLLGGFWWLARVEARHEEATGIRTADRPTRAGTSGDLHLFLGLPESAAAELDTLIAEHAKDGSVEPASVESVAAALVSLFEKATHAHAEFGHFRRIGARADSGVARIAYLHVRTRRAIVTIVDRSRREQWRPVLEGLSGLRAPDVVELELASVRSTTDPADPKLVAWIQG